MSEDIISELSRFRELFVIARNSSFSYKGKATKVQDIAKDLGIRYVLEGSLRMASDRIRVTAQLIDAATGHHIWTERYDRQITDLFSLQDEIAQTVAGTVAGRLQLTEQDRANRKPIGSLEAYDYALRAQSIIADTKENNLRAREAYEKAIELDPTCTRAYVGLALSYVIEDFNNWWDPSDPPLDHALEYAAKAVALNNTDSKAQLMLGNVYHDRGEYEEAGVHLERALELNPNDADAFAFMGIYRTSIGKPDEAIQFFRKAIRLNPYYPAWYLWVLGRAYYTPTL
jgi:adenylate cyclase